MEQFVVALRDNLQRYETRFGAIPPQPRPPSDRRPTLQEIYDEFKLPEDQLSGTYANAVMVGHSPSEFFLDFITNFFPTSAVSSRVFLSAAQMPRVLDALSTALQRYQQRHRGPQAPPPQGPTGTPPPQGT